MNSRIYRGTVLHHRFEPREHRFKYELFLFYLDLGELPKLFDKFLLWSARRPAFAWYRRADHMGDTTLPLDQCVRDLVHESTGNRPTGPIRLLTHLRYFGYIINPVSFYYCWDKSDQKLQYVVAEVTNTPWGESHCYVADLTRHDPNEVWFNKAMHVSPFLTMDQRYHWRLTTPSERLSVEMQNYQGDKRTLLASLQLYALPINAGNLWRVLLQHPTMTLKVVTAIYWQAFRLWRKRIPFYAHPKHAPAGEKA